jgi:hypothetical protein
VNKFKRFNQHFNHDNGKYSNCHFIEPPAKAAFKKASNSGKFVRLAAKKRVRGKSLFLETVLLIKELLFWGEKTFKDPPADLRGGKKCF